MFFPPDLVKTCFRELVLFCRFPKSHKEVLQFDIMARSLNSDSVHFEQGKKKGEDLYYQTLLNAHLAPVVFVQRMTQALSHFRKASAHVSNKKQEASIAKLMGTLQYHCGKVLNESYLVNVRTLPKSDHESDRLLIDYYLNEAMIEFERALKCRPVKSSQWRDEIDEDMKNCAHLLFQFHYVHPQLSEQSFSAKTGRLEVLCHRSLGYYRGIFFIALAMMVCEEAEKLQRVGDFRNAAQLLRSNQARIEEARKVQEYSDIEELQLKTDKLLNVVESMKAKQQGDDLWSAKKSSPSKELSKQIVLEDSEELPHYILEAVDWYKTAIDFARLGQSLEDEAKAHVQIGIIYEEKVKDKSRKHYEIAANLAMRIGDCGNKKWYRLCLEGIKNLDWVQQWIENRDREVIRTAIRQQLAAQLIELKEAASRAVEELLELIYNKYPPKSPDVEKPEGTNLKVKIKRALLHYHPDKQHVHISGLHWMVFAEEITVLLNEQYTRLFKT